MAKKSWRDYYDREKAREYGRKYRENKRLKAQGLLPETEKKPDRPAKRATLHEDGTRSYDGSLVYLPKTGEEFPSDVEPLATVQHNHGGVSYKHQYRRWWGDYYPE